ncbi:transposable element Tcb2 transposase [Trichonephila clavipes]|nr:transposable element Tcb2 transposase [Trichonephila clavipes]
MQVTVRFDHPNLNGEHSGGGQRPPPLFPFHQPNEKDLRLDGYLDQKTARWWSVCTTPCTVCTPLTPAHQRRRSLWCREHRNWRDNEWGQVLFTDESRFSLSSDSLTAYSSGESGEAAIIPRTSLKGTGMEGRGVLVWGGIMLGSRTDLHIFDAGSVNGTRYCNEILLPYVSFRGAMGLQFPFHGRQCTMSSHSSCRTALREQTLGSSYLTTSNDSGALIGAARRMGSNASTTH